MGCRALPHALLGLHGQALPRAAGARSRLQAGLYLDQAQRQKAGGKVDKNRLTQVERALSQLGIEHIASYFPEARGRIERLFGTLQGRLSPGAAPGGITGIEQANRYLAETFLPAFNARFAIAAAEAGSAFLPYVGRALEDILTVQETRLVQNDNCVRYNALSLQIPEQTHRRHFVKAAVTVRQYPDQRLAIFYGPRCLARYNKQGALLEPQNQRVA